MAAKNKSLKVFSKLYVGFRNQHTGVRLGFATPYEDNAAGKKRQQTVDTWAHYYGHGDNIPAEIIENEPVAGFRITDDVKRRYWGGGNVVFRVEDPRGFELEIQSHNVMMLLSETTIEKGEIQGKCIWARDGATNVLIHESSDEYKSALEAAEKLTVVSSSEFEPGDEITLKSGTTVQYMGRFWFYAHRNGKLLKPVLFYSVCKAPGSYELYRKLNVIKVVKGSGEKLSAETALQQLFSPGSRISDFLNSYSTTWFTASQSGSGVPRWERVPLSPSDISELREKIEKQGSMYYNAPYFFYDYQFVPGYVFESEGRDCAIDRSFQAHSFKVSEDGQELLQCESTFSPLPALARAEFFGFRQLQNPDHVYLEAILDWFDKLAAASKLFKYVPVLNEDAVK